MYLHLKEAHISKKKTNMIHLSRLYKQIILNALSN